MADVAKAYVQIIPSAEGIKGKLEQTLSGEAASAGEKAGGSLAGGLGKAMGGVAKVTAGAFAATSAAVGAIAKQSVDAYGDFEQLEGGIETLFGSAAPAVMKNAEQAFKTAGTSMNDYMETSIQSAAAMITSLDGDQAKAADLMDMSIVDMADNVNKMGTSMEGVQSAYRGFSRGNFTMLDNLALGFAGTKEGMQELLDKAQEISGVEFNIDSYADIVQAIHTVQEDMGIAGTTMKEGTETIQGSLTTLKGAWENLVAGFGKEDANLDELIGNLVDSAGAVLENLEPIIEKVLNGIGEFIGKAAPILAEQLPTLVSTLLPVLLDAASELISAIASALPELISSLLAEAPSLIATLIQTGFDLILELLNGMTAPGAMDKLMNGIVEIVETIADWICEYADVLIEGAVTLVTTLATALTEPNTLVRLVEAALKLIIALAEGLLRALPQLIAAVPVIITNLFTALVQGVPKIAEAAVELVKAIFQTFTSIDWLGLGKDIITGIINGIISMAGALVDTMKNLAKSALEGAKNLLGIHSPSKVFRDDVGQMIGLGMVEGIEESINPVQNAMNALSAASIGKMNASNQIKNSGYGQMQLAGAGFGDITIPVYIGSTKMGQAVASANNMNNYRSGGR